MTAHPTTLWWLGEDENDLYGFVSKSERDACERGEPGPFTRILRNLNTNPVTIEERAIRVIAQRKEIR